MNIPEIFPADVRLITKNNIFKVNVLYIEYVCRTKVLIESVYLTDGFINRNRILDINTYEFTNFFLQFGNFSQIERTEKEFTFSS